MPRSYELKGGPQDGGWVCEIGGKIPPTIFVGPVWQGDGFVAYSSGQSDRFPVRHDRNGDLYEHAKGESDG